MGIVENMSGYVCPSCGTRINLFKSGGGEALAAETHVPFLGKIPIDPDIVTSGDSGSTFIGQHAETTAGAAFAELVSAVLARHSEASRADVDERRAVV